MLTREAATNSPATDRKKSNETENPTHAAVDTDFGSPWS